jgi:predicted ABC-type ATPase
MQTIDYKVSEMLVSGSSTLDYYFEQNLHLSDQRQALHVEIVHDILYQQDYSRNRQVFMLGGAPGNGKTSLLRSGFLSLPPAALRINSDDIKLRLPEYQFMLAKKESRAAVTVHDESSQIGHKLRAEALKMGLDIVWDGMANESVEHRTGNISELKMYGHSVRIDYVTLDTKLSLQIAEERFKKTGRKVPEDIIHEKNRSIAALVPALISAKVFDELHLWDTNITNQPRLILSQKSGILEVKDENLYRNFKMKNYVSPETTQSAHKSRKRYHRL